MDTVRTLLEHQPMVALFATIAIGYLLGEVDIKGLSLGVGAVLFVGLAVGWLAPAAAPPPMVGTLGLALCLYAMGIEHGDDFFRGLTSAEGRRANLVGLTGVIGAVAVTLALVGRPVRLADALGLFSGTLVNTPALQAAAQRLGGQDSAVGYAVTYPLGAIGPILLLYVASLVRKTPAESPGAGGPQLLEIAIRNPEVVGATLADVVRSLSPQVRIIAVRGADRNRPASPGLVLHEDDVVLAVSASAVAIEEARRHLGDASSGRLADDRHDLDYLTVLVARPAVVGKSLGDLLPPDGLEYSVVRVRRGDHDLLAESGLVLEFGDRLGLLANRAHFSHLRRFFGDSVKGAAEFSYVSVGIGMAAGFLIGAIAVPIPGMGTISIGVMGVLVVALVLGRRRRIGPMSWTIPASASLVLRKLGLTLFLAQVGMASGPRFAAALTQTGLLFLGLGTVILTALALPVFFFGLHVFKLPFDEVAGILAGVTGNPTLLAYTNKLTSSDRPAVAYAMISPGMTILQVFAVDLVAAVFGK